MKIFKELFSKIINLFFDKEVFYINGKETLPPPLDKDEESYKIYKWEVTKDTSVEVNFPNSGKSTIKINFDSLIFLLFK